MLLLSKELPNLNYRHTLQRFDEDWRDPLSALLGWGALPVPIWWRFF